MAQIHKQARKQISNHRKRHKCPREPACAFRATCPKSFKAEDAIFCRDYCVQVTNGEHPRIEEGIFRTSKHKIGAQKKCNTGIKTE